MIKNITKNTTIAHDFRWLTGLKKMLGLMGIKKAEPIVFETRFGIHTFFLKFPIDLIVLDQKGKVYLAKTIFPNRISFWNIRFNKVLELPKGTIKSTKTQIGDTIKFLP